MRESFCVCARQICNTVCVRICVCVSVCTCMHVCATECMHVWLPNFRTSLAPSVQCNPIHTHTGICVCVLAHCQYLCFTFNCDTIFIVFYFEP